MYKLVSLANTLQLRQTFTICLKCIQKQTETSARSQLLGPGHGFRACAAYSSCANPDGAWIKPKGTRTGIKVYNTQTRQKEDLILPNGNHLSWYICGPTVYDSSHIGHASNYVRFDIIRRILLAFFDINVTYLMGITDIDDKIINRANELEKDFTEITSYYEREFFHEMMCLNIMSPTMMSRVTEHVDEIIVFIQGIIDKGHAYQGSDGSIYFDVAAFGNYNKLKPGSEDNDASSDTDSNYVKRSSSDFALWKAVKPGEPFWKSPWGNGRPGWHIECSAMASNMFGSSFDFHSGGIDLLFPHHENEIAQSCSFHGTEQWVNYWLHTGYLHLQFDPHKMSKSLKNIIPTRELLQNYTANQFRMFCMLTHYRNNIEFADEKMEKAVAMDARIGTFLRQCEAYMNGQTVDGNVPEVETYQKLQENKEQFMEHLRDDFNTPEAMKCLFDLIADLNVAMTAPESSPGCRNPGVVAAAQVHVKRICKKLGFHKKGWKLDQQQDDLRLRTIVDHTVKFRYNMREFALNTKLPVTGNMSSKEQKKASAAFFKPLYDNCDNLRTELSNCGISVQDMKTSSTWSFDDAFMSDESDLDQSDTEAKS